jgi:hypothetical protein
MKIREVGEGVEWKSALFPTSPNELNYALPWLLVGQIKKTSGTFKIGQYRPKKHLTLLAI